jgi:tripartite-type tricarboxylate transporter receptor subunit TctC
MKRRNFLIVLNIILFWIIPVFLFTSFASAAYPEKPVTLICVWGTGGANDAIARSIALYMKKYFPQPLVVVNRPGGSGTVGMAEIVSSKPDGYTIGSTTMSSLTILPHQISLPYNTPDDYLPIALVGTQTFTMMCNSEMPYKTLKEFVEYAKAHPGKVRVGTGGIGHISHLILEQFKIQAQIDMIDVPFKGGGELIAAILGKHVETSVLTMHETLPHYQAGKVRILGVFDEKRRPPITEIPTVKELGYEVAMLTYTLLVGPKDLPPDIASKIRDAYKKTSEDPEFVKFIESQGMNVQYEGTEDLRKRLWKDYKANKGVFERLEQLKKK